MKMVLNDLIKLGSTNLPVFISVLSVFNKVVNPYSVTFLIRAPICERYVVCVAPRTNTKK